ncbi:acyl-CoA thioesterase [Tannerella forsythia]|uniref:Acyl-CoA thioesterase n=1 Tax=Tannerella forsythia TaxID=28112 RepID=A0A3P1YRW0_TANFO|nr:thioesterase family protein [Tannerella forsythia]RRD73744.1 acyl-CoA thioesterase [Tannerella forsythia]
MEKVLKASKEFDVRFSEVDSMHIVWHGSYALYFEDAREEFGRVFGLSYHEYIANEYFAPLVDLNFQYKKPLLYGQRARIDITYRNTPAAKVIFDYEIRLLDDDSLIATGFSTQVFLDREYRLMWTNPPFYEAWKKKHGQL